MCELCCGIGISLIELSKSFSKVIGVDNDAAILNDCETNLKQYGVKNCQLLCGDVSDKKLLAQITADVMLYDIPYWSDHNGVVNPAEQNPDLRQLIANIREATTPNIVIYAPTHMTYQKALAELGACDYVEVYANGKYDRNFIFLGGLMEQEGKSQITV